MTPHDASWHLMFDWFQPDALPVRHPASTPSSTSTQHAQFDTQPKAKAASTPSSTSVAGPDIRQDFFFDFFPVQPDCWARCPLPAAGPARCRLPAPGPVAFSIREERFHRVLCSRIFNLTEIWLDGFVQGVDDSFKVLMIRSRCWRFVQGVGLSGTPSSTSVAGLATWAGRLAGRLARPETRREFFSFFSWSGPAAGPGAGCQLLGRPFYQS